VTATTSLAARFAPIAQQKHSPIVAVTYVLLAALVLFPHFIISAFIGAPGLACIAAITIGALLISTEIAFTLLVLCLFLQNLFIAIVTPLAGDLEHFEPMLATSFINIVLTSGFAAVAWLKMRNDLPDENRALMHSLILFFGVVVFYAIIGAMHATLNDALIYTRVYVVGGLFLIIGIAFGLRLTPAFTANVFRALTFFLVLWGILEFFFAYDLYSFFNIADYLHLKYASSLTTDVTNVQDMIDFASRSYLNLSGALGLHLDLLRPQGPNIHPISYAYALAFGALVCYINRFPILMLLSLALLLLVGAKGPLIMTFVSIALATVYWLKPSRKTLLGMLIASMVLYAFIGIVYGIYTEDYHVVGFMGGVKGFLANPFGRGVGVGGNLSSMAQYTDFGLFQGYGASFALESGFGVMIYQIGIGAAAFFLFYWRLWKNVWNATLVFSDQPRLIVLPCALALLLVNSIFQEEAFSPAGWGPLLLLSGLLLAHAWQKQKPISPQKI
jgi:hypothetical protein